MSATPKSHKTVIVGATGLVGTEIIRTLERFPLPVDSLDLLATARSAGQQVEFRGDKFTVKEFSPDFFRDAEWVFFSGKDGLSEEFCPVAANEGAWVIDNSSVFRMHDDVPLVVPEINLDAVGDIPGIIANPNCSTIQLAVALAPIRDKYGLRRVIVSTYQSASGAGGEYLDALMKDSELFLEKGWEALGRDSLAFNCLPAVGDLQEGERFSEETKLENELKKILNMPDLKISATAVRVPVAISHSESVIVETEKPADPSDVRRLLDSMPGIGVLDHPESRNFPTPRQAEFTDPVWVGRIRKAGIFDNDLALWVVADNLRKGAALNAVQIAVAINERESAGDN
jgi:aspartate-semialdehyde dehydrogenase